MAQSPDGPDVELRSLLDRYGALIRRIVARVGGRAVREMQDDIAQTVAMNLWQQVSREQTITHASSYIYRAAIRETVRAVKRELARVRQHAPLDAEPVEPSSEAPGPEADALARELGQGIQRALDRLSPDRAAAVRAHLMGFTVDEIMRVHRWPYQKARNLIARGLSELRVELAKGGWRE